MVCNAVGLKFDREEIKHDAAGRDGRQEVNLTILIQTKSSLMSQTLLTKIKVMIIIIM